jgi:hypothetical protein
VLPALLFFSLPLRAAEVAGVSIPDRVDVVGVERPLLLNGAGVRKKFFFKIYIGALYLPTPRHSAKQIIQSAGPKRILMYFLYDEVGREKLTDGWWSGFRANHDESAIATLKTRIGQFSDLFDDAKRDDQVWVDYLPGKGTRVTINGKLRGIVPGADFNRALLRIWLGDEPVTEDLKQALLGLE